MKHLVMLGAGLAHIHMLASMAARPLAGVQITLVAPYSRQLYSGMVAGFVAGHHTADDCSIALAPLLAHSDVSWLQRSAVGLDANAHRLHLDDGSTLEFDLLSLNTERFQDRQKIEQVMQGARKHALFAHPVETFATLWPQVLEFALDRALRVAVIGGGSGGIELALAVAHRLKGASVTLLTGEAPVLANSAPAVQTRVLRALKKRHITLIRERVCGIAATEIQLSNGAQLACDVPIVTCGAHPPRWLDDSGLALDETGFVAVDAFGRATSHPEVFSLADSVHAGPPLAKNLRAMLAGIAPSGILPQPRKLQFIDCGDQTAIASWGHYATQGHLAGWLKNRLDRGLVQQYRQTAKG